MFYAQGCGGGNKNNVSKNFLISFLLTLLFVVSVLILPIDAAFHIPQQQMLLSSTSMQYNKEKKMKQQQHYQEYCSITNCHKSTLLKRIFERMATTSTSTSNFARTKMFATSSDDDDDMNDGNGKTMMTPTAADESTLGAGKKYNNEKSSTPESCFNVQVNEFFKKPVPKPIQNYLDPNQKQQEFSSTESATITNVWNMLIAPPTGVPRPLWLVILGSVPTGLVWYGYYKFCVEEELLQQDLRDGKTPRGYGGYGTLGPFVYGVSLGPIAYLLHIPGGLNWSNVGIAFIFYTQFLLYDRVNELYRAEGLEEPCPIWWTLPIFFPFDLIVGLRQVHSLSEYWYRRQQDASAGEGLDVNTSSTKDAPTTFTSANCNIDPVVDFFPFISAPRFTWQEFIVTPSLWCKLLANVQPIDLPDPIQSVLNIGNTTTEVVNKQK